MKRMKFRSGDILQITLPNELGFAYAKGINLLELYLDAQYPTLINVYNYRSSIEKIEIEEIVNKKLILCPLLIAGILQVLKEGSWKIIGNEPIQKSDIVIPNYKKGPDELNKDWYYIIDADISKKVKSSYENVKHLETIGAKGSELVGTKIAMALLQDEGKKIEDYFDLKQYFEIAYYKEVIEIPAYYKQPEHMQGKAITK